MQTHSENTQMMGGSPLTERPAGSAGSMSIPTLEPPSSPSPLSSAIAACLRLRRSPTSSDKSSRCENASPKPTSSKTSAPPSTISVKGLKPYWDEKRLNAWIGTYRFVYNETIWLLNLRIVHPNFMDIKKYLIPHLAEEYPWTKDCPRAIRDGAVAEACQTVKQAIATFKRTGEFSRCRYKSRKDAQQSFFLRNDQWSKSKRGFNVSALGEMKFAEALPMTLRDGRVITFANKWSVCMP